MLCLHFESGGEKRLFCDSFCFHTGFIVLCSALGFFESLRCLLLSAIGTKTFCDEHFFMKCLLFRNSPWFLNKAALSGFWVPVLNLCRFSLFKPRLGLLWATSCSTKQWRSAAENLGMAGKKFLSSVSLRFKFSFAFRKFGERWLSNKIYLHCVDLLQ